jgi:hypothetical protein
LESLKSEKEVEETSHNDNVEPDQGIVVKTL